MIITQSTVLFFKMYIFIFLVVLIESSSCGQILCIFPTPFHTHQTVFQPLWRELSLRGHKVTVLTTNPLKDASLTNLTEIDLSFTHKLVYQDHNMQHVLNTESNLLTLMKHVFFIMNNMTVEQLQHAQVEELIKSDVTFDLMIIEEHVAAWFGLAKKFRCPIIAASSMDATSHFKRMMGDLYNPILTPHMNLPFDQDLSFFQRVLCVVFDLFDGFQTKYLISPMQQKIIRQALNEPDLNLYQIQKENVSLMFVTIIPGFNKMTTTIPSIIQLSGLQIKPSQPLPQKLDDFLKGATNGAIYISLGTNVKSFLLSEKKRSLFFKVLQELPYRVVWKFEDEISGVPKNVVVVTWAPQQDILRHNNIKLFITQGGLQSIEEAIRFKVPILGIPFFGDQFHNVIQVKHLKIGSWIDFKDLTQQSFHDILIETINNDTYLQNLEEMSDLLADPIVSLNKAVRWVEYVIQHKGVKHLRSPLADMPFHQYYLFDVIAFIALFSVTITLLLLQLIKILMKVERNRGKMKSQ